MTTDKNNSCHPGVTAPGFKIVARLRGEKEEVVVTSCAGYYLVGGTAIALHIGKSQGSG